MKQQWDWSKIRTDYERRRIERKQLDWVVWNEVDWWVWSHTILHNASSSCFCSSSLLPFLDFISDRAYDRFIEPQLVREKRIKHIATKFWMLNRVSKKCIGHKKKFNNSTPFLTPISFAKKFVLFDWFTQNRSHSSSQGSSFRSYFCVIDCQIDHHQSIVFHTGGFFSFE